VLLAGPAAAGAPEVRSALRKLVRALPDTFRADAEAAAGAVVVDPARWGGTARPATGPVGTVRAAVVRRRKLRLAYAGRTGTTERLVDPYGLIDKDDVWYLIAGTERGRRTFRLDRVVAAEVTDEPADRPADFDLAGAWSEVVDAMERRRSLVAATVLADGALVPVLRDRFGRHCAVEDTGGPGPARLRVAAHTARSLAEQLAGFGTAVDVVEPEAVRTELGRLGAELAARYGDAPSGRARIPP
jgi:predicted DNA-binding transcriptional regulator YafY